jgi:pyruvate dehydrogenase E2 component (dihydrolipoyllysine-residue acetyltransferase)
MHTTDFAMPKLGLTMTEGTIARWALKPGDRFAAGDVVVVVETDKIAYEVEAHSAGVLKEVLVPEGAVAAVGMPIGRWEVAEDSGKSTVHRFASEGAAAPPTESHRMPMPAGGVAPTHPWDGRRFVATPLARRLAREARIDLGAIAGSGPGGRIKADDVNRALAMRAAPAARQAVPLAPAPQAWPGVAAAEVDVTRLLALNADIVRDAQLDPQLVHYVVLAASRALDREPIALAAARPERSWVFNIDDYRSLTAVLTRTRANADDLPSNGGALWIAQAEDGIAFLAGQAPAGWRAFLGVGSLRHQFRPDAQGERQAAATVSLVVTLRHAGDPVVSPQGLLLRIKHYLENPLHLLTS